MNTNTSKSHQTRMPFALALLCLVLGMGLAVQGQVWTFTNNNSTAWSQATNWVVSTGGNSVPPLGVTNFPGRFNVAAVTADYSREVTVVYDSPLSTGFGSIDTASPTFGRAISVGNGTGTTGTLHVVNGTLLAFQAILAEPVIVCAPANLGATSRGHLLLDGGNLTVIATNYGFVTSPFRGSPDSLGIVTVQNGSTLKVDRFRFGSKDSYGDIATNLPGVLNLNTNGTLNVRNIANTFPDRILATNNFNGGTLQVLASETLDEGNNPLIGTTIFNNILAGGLIVDTVTNSGRIMSPLLNGVAGTDGGIRKKGTGTLNLRGAGSTYTGPSVVEAGTLGVQVPMTSTSFQVNSGAGLNFITDNTAAWSVPSLALTNGSLGFDYGTFAGYTNAVVNVSSLYVQGSVQVKIVGDSFPVTNLTLMTYTGPKTGGGSFTLGTGSLPPGMVASLTDTGSALVLNITSASIQNLVWSAAYGTWETNGAANWNNFASTYLEYPGGFGDNVTFNDAYSASGDVYVSGTVKPSSITVNSTNTYAFTGAGTIAGATGIAKAGSGLLRLNTTNDFTGAVAVVAGRLAADTDKALGATNGNVTVSVGATLQVGLSSLEGGNDVGVTVSNKSITLKGGGIDTVRGALRGGYTASGANVWAGPILIDADATRIGTEDFGNLTLAGPVTATSPTFGVILRAGQSGRVTVSGSISNVASTETYGHADGSGTIYLAANNALSTNRLRFGLGFLDLGGFNHTWGGIQDVTSPGTITNSTGVSTVTINTGTNSVGTSGNFEAGTGSISLVKLGTGTQSLYGTNLSYTGTTTVSEGRLNLDTTNTMSTSISVASGAALGGEFTTTGSITLATNTTLFVNPSTAEAITANTISASTGPINVEFTAGFPGLGAVLVLKATNPINAVTNNFQAGGRGGSFSLAAGDTELYFTPSSLPNLVWVGNDPTNPTFWDTQVTTNWLNLGAPDIFFIGDTVLFNDSASNFVVAAQGTVIPSTVTFNNSISNYTVSGIIGGSATLSKSGSASLTLSGSSSYSGVTTISAGTVVAGNGNALGAKTAGTTISGTGALEINGQNLGAEEITISGTGFGGNGTIVNSGVDQINALQKVVLGGNASIGGTKRWDLRGTGNYLDMNGFTLTKVGSNYIALVGTLLTNTPGNIVIQSGTLGIQTTADLLGSSANTVTVQTGAALENYQTTALQYWSLVMQDGSTFWAENGSGLQNTWAGPVTLNGGATLRADGVMTISGDISGSGSVTKTGGSVATLSSFNNTYNGPTTINGGRLAIDGILTTSPVVVNSGGTLSGYGTINSTVTVTNNGKIVPGNVGAALVSGIGTLTVGSLTLHVGATADFEITDSVLLDQVTVSTSGGLTLNGGGINLYNPGTNSAFAVNGTYPLFNYSGALNGSVSNLTVLNPVVGKTYAFSATGSQVQVTIGDGPAPIFWGVNLDGSWATPGNWAPNTVPNGQFVTANFGGTNNPVITGPRTVTLDGSYTVGSLVFSNAQPFTVNQGSGGTIQLDNGAGVPVISQLGGSHTINAPLALPVQGASVTVASATTLSLNGAVSGTGGLTKAGTGTNVLAGANSYSGATLVNAGTLVVSNNTALGSTAGATILNTGAANNTATVVLANGVTVTGETITINGYGQNVRGSLQAGNGATAEWAGPVSLGNGVVGDGNRIGAQANGTLKISGPITNGTIPDLYISADGNTGTVIVSGANTYSGQSAIIRGTLKLGANNSLPVGSLLNVHSASGVSDRAVFDLAGYNQQVAGVVRGNTSGPALVTNSSPTLATLTVSNTLGYAFDSLIGGNLSFVKTGSGSQTNSAANTYTGNTTVNAGTLVIAQATLNTNSTVSIATNAVLRLNFSTTNLVAALVLNGINQPAGVYNSVNAASYIAGTGSLQVPSLVVPPPSTGTNITYTVSAGQITLTWPSNYTGWYLQSQTNGLNAGLSNNWVTVSGSQNTNQVTLPVAGTNPAVFFRMVYTNAP